jgi:hypothetical protein
MVHTALSNANFECAEIVLFSQQEAGGEHNTLPSLNDLLHNLEDGRGDNILAALVRYTDLSYDDPTCSTISERMVASNSYNLLKIIIHHLEGTGDTRPLLKKNAIGENAAAVAARCGTLHDFLKLFKLIKFMDNICIANVCTHPTEFGSAAVQSPLDLAKATKSMIALNLAGIEGGSVQVFENAGICGCDDYVRDKLKMRSWKNLLIY